MLKALFGWLFGRRPTPPARPPARVAPAPAAPLPPTAPAPETQTQDDPGFRKLNRDGHTIVLTTHYLEEAETLCGRIAMLKSGKVVALDTTDNLLRRFATHSLRARLAHPERGVVLGGRAAEGGWVEFAFDSYAEVESLLARLREAGAGLTEMQLGEPDLERVFVEVMNRA